MKEWKQAIVSPETTLQDSIIKMDASGFQFVLVLDQQGHLAGVVTDGDIRRAILRSVCLSVSVKEIMNPKPITAGYMSPKTELLNLMRTHNLHHIPLINSERQVVNLSTINELIGFWERPNWVVLMAGGLGTRLRPLTANCPKPMLQIGNKPILETIIDSFIEQGFRKFYLSVNYLAEVIQEYFGDGSSFGIEIRYLKEKQSLGTAGALSLLPERHEDPLVVMNGDVLTSINFDQMLNFHQTQQAVATMAVREYDFQVPYGVIKLNGLNIEDIDEKPKHRFFVNAGIYALSAEAMDHIPSNTAFDMPSLFKTLRDEEQCVVAYPLREKWIDIGRMEEFEYAKEQWKQDKRVTEC